MQMCSIMASTLKARANQARPKLTLVSGIDACIVVFSHDKLGCVTGRRGRLLPRPGLVVGAPAFAAARRVTVGVGRGGVSVLLAGLGVAVQGCHVATARVLHIRVAGALVTTPPII